MALDRLASRGCEGDGAALDEATNGRVARRCLVDRPHGQHGDAGHENDVTDCRAHVVLPPPLSALLSP